MSNKYPGYCADCHAEVQPNHGKLVKIDGRWKVSCQADQKRKAAVAESRAAEADIELPCPDGLEYLPYQKAGINYALKRSGVLFGDEMGLGKTIQAIGVINADESIKKVLVICPASLRLNWKRELERWLTRSMSISVAVGNDLDLSTDIVIINYDIVDRHKDKLAGVAWDALISDEAHYLKNERTKRTKAVLGSKTFAGISARRKMFLTGTPIPNRPIEAFPILKALGLFKSFMYYGKQYCGAYHNGYGWDFSGASNLASLQSYMREKVMVRRLKSEVLTELPAKRRQVIEVPANGATKQVKAESEAASRHADKTAELQARIELAKASDDEEAYKAAVAELQEAARVMFTEMSRLRHETAVAKIPHVVEHVENAIGGSGKVVVFAHHKDVVNGLMDEFGDRAVKLTGETPMAQRQEAVDRFQSDPTIQVFVGNIQAAGVGITLTAASHVVFAELDWVPGNITQAEDRCHRIGQTNSVLVQHLVFDESIDANMAHALTIKQDVLDRALDRREAEVPVVPTTAKHATEPKVPELSEDQVQAIHEGVLGCEMTAASTRSIRTLASHWHLHPV
jgi:SWI/SNF-related matrix-associated actin-dependent regulator 1 of chromatin subfamily A